MCVLVEVFVVNGDCPEGVSRSAFRRRGRKFMKDVRRWGKDIQFSKAGDGADEGEAKYKYKYKYKYRYKYRLKYKYKCRLPKRRLPERRLFGGRC